MREVGTVREVWRYPVKSFQGERVERLEIGPGGSGGDRVLAVVDIEAGKVLSAKRHADLLFASARTVDGGIVVTLPDATELDAQDPSVHGALSEWLGRAVRLDPPPDGPSLPMELHAGMSDEDTPVIDWAGPAGTWLDLADVHWLTTASIDAIAARHPVGQWDVRRFRPTALIWSAAGEDELTWPACHIGSAETTTLMPTPRCSQPSRAQPGLERDKAIGTTIRDHNENNLGIYASVTRSGAISLGDPVLVP